MEVGPGQGMWGTHIFLSLPVSVAGAPERDPHGVHQSGSPGVHGEPLEEGPWWTKATN